MRDCSSFPTVGQINEIIFVKCWLLTMGSGYSETLLALDKFFASLASAATFITTIDFKIDAFQSVGRKSILTRSRQAEVLGSHLSERLTEN